MSSHKIAKSGSRKKLQDRFAVFSLFLLKGKKVDFFHLVRLSGMRH